MGFFPPTGEVDLPEGFFESLKPFMKKQTSPTLPVIRPREDPRITLPDIPPTLPVIRPREDLRVGLPAPVLPDPQLIEVPSDNFIQTDISQESSVISGSVIAFRQASYMRPYLKYSYLGEVIGDLSIVGHAPARYEGRDPLYVVFGNYARSFISFKPRTFSELVPKEIKIEYIMEEVNFNGVAKAKFYLCDNARAVKLVFEDLSGKEIITVYFDYDAYLRGVIEDDSTVFPPEPLEDVIPTEPHEEPTSVITEEEPTSVIAEEQKEEKKSKWYLWLGIGVIILVVFFMLRR